MGHSKILRNQRAKMWEHDPRCRKCGVVTVLPEHITYHVIVSNNIRKMKLIPDNMATIQHFHSRNNPLRGQFGGKGIRTHALWCSKCNKEDDKNEVANIPIEQRREAANKVHNKPGKP